jgi:Sigma-70 region 2
VELSDEALCQRVGAQRDDDAFEQLLERHQRRAYRLAWSIIGDADEAKDLSQEAFLRLFERASSFDGRSNSRHGSTAFSSTSFSTTVGGARAGCGAGSRSRRVPRATTFSSGSLLRPRTTPRLALRGSS